MGNSKWKKVADASLPRPSASRGIMEIILQSYQINMKLQQDFVNDIRGAGGQNREHRNTKIREWFKDNFTKYANKNDEISRQKFIQACKSLPDFNEYVFFLFDTDDSGSVSIQELLGGFQKLSTGEADEKTIRWFEKRFQKHASSEEELDKEKFMLAINNDQCLLKLFDLFDMDKGGHISIEELVRGVDKLTCMNKDAKWLAWLEQQFSRISGESRQISLHDFTEVLQVKELFFAEQFFKLFDKDRSGTISLSELIDGLNMLMEGTDMDKLKFLFDVYDVDGNGTIDPDELKIVLRSCMDESKLELSEETLDELTQTLFESADADQSGSITFEELHDELLKHPGVIENLTISASNWLKPPPPPANWFRAFIQKYLSFFSKSFLVNNMALVSNMTVLVTIMVVLFFVGAWLNGESLALMIAKGTGKMINLCVVLLFLTMSRYLLTKIRATPLSKFLALDQAIDFHKAIGVFCLILSAIHTVAHLFYLGGTSKGYQYLVKLFWIHDDTATLGWFGTAYATGALLVLISITMALCSHPYVRREGYFQVFYFSHMLYIPYAALLFFHSKSFFMWATIPALIFIVEFVRKSRIFTLSYYGHTYVNDANILPSRVVHIEIGRPKGFRFNAGDYIFVNIPKIARYEWHPFTISSSAEGKYPLSLHVRAVGNWTNKLYDYVKVRHDHVEEDKLEYINGKSVLALGDSNNHLNDTSHVGLTEYDKQLSAHSSINSCSDWKQIEVFIDGPYGAPAVDIFESEHAVLIAAGIGVTPYASILQTIVHKYQLTNQKCPECGHRWVPPENDGAFKIKKVDFFWINRDQHSFEWFLKLMTQLETDAKEISVVDDNPDASFLDLHMYMTSALRKSDVKAVGLQMALELMHEKSNKDVITGLKARTKAGRPDWKEVFTELNKNKKGKVTVFFCGSPILAQVINTYCNKFGFRFKAEKF
ncbi:NADPH oxidase 5-like isoform X2 [Bolinopsis microptera]|uniref:NADPH oxidase 5-like isoform X2 n=1 Tax=Bolinopsis microptera TaxID=2820187 RepID=UPI003078D3C7